MLKDLKQYVINSALEQKVHFIGYLDNIDKYRAYHAADLLVVPSRSEVISMVALEAGLTATPVLITDKCGFNELSKTNGGIVVAATSDGIEKGLIEMLRIDGIKPSLHGFSHGAWQALIAVQLNEINNLYSKLCNCQAVFLFFPFFQSSCWHNPKLGFDLFCPL